MLGSSDVITICINGVARGTLNYTGSFDTPIKYLGVGNINANNGGIENFFHGYLGDPQYSNYAKYTVIHPVIRISHSYLMVQSLTVVPELQQASISFGDWNFGNGKQDANAGTTNPTGSVVADGLQISAPQWSYGDWWTNQIPNQAQLQLELQVGIVTTAGMAQSVCTD